MIVSKEISVSSRAFTVCGYASDPYFRNIETHLQHGFLIFSIADDGDIRSGGAKMPFQPVSVI